MKFDRVCGDCVFMRHRSGTDDSRRSGHGKCIFHVTHDAGPIAGKSSWSHFPTVHEQSKQCAHFKDMDVVEATGRLE